MTTQNAVRPRSIARPAVLPDAGLRDTTGVRNQILDDVLDFGGAGVTDVAVLGEADVRAVIVVEDRVCAKVTFAAVFETVTITAWTVQIRLAQPLLVIGQTILVGRSSVWVRIYLRPVELCFL